MSNMYRGVNTFVSFVKSSPASMTPTDTVGISVSRLASTRPAVPPPAMRKSKFVEANASGVVIEVIFRVEDLKSRADLQNKREDGRDGAGKLQERDGLCLK